ncbi:MAG: IucA/IucC family protein [Actinoplanes sp.]
MPDANDAPTRHTMDAAGTREDLTVLRPDLVQRYDAALPAARAAILARLLGALDREPLPGRRAVHPGRVTFPPPAGSPPAAPMTVRYDTDAAAPFAAVAAGLTADVDGRPIDDPGTLTRLLWGDVALAAEIDNSVANLALARAAAAQSEAATALAGAVAGAGAAQAEAAAARARATQAPAGAAAARAAQARAAQAEAAAAAALAGAAAQARAAAHTGPFEHAQGEPCLDQATHPIAGDAGHGRAVLPSAGRGDGAGAFLLGGGVDGLALVEQGLTDGHPLHPCCRTRGGMTVADVLAYAPEHRPVIRLRRLRVPADRWFGTAPPILYAHPWQADRIRERYPWLEDAGQTPPVRPLMSLRTVAPVGGGPHIKTAVEVQMTSAVRTVSPAAVTNGPVLSALLRELTADLPIGVLAETAAGAVVDDGEPRRELAYLTREAPALAPGETVVPLAAFGAVPGLLSTVTDPYAWWDRLCAVLFAPLMTVLERGVALEAHGQNTLLVLRDGRPGRVLYRDLGGVRVSAARLRAAGLDAPELAGGDLASDDPLVLRTKLAAAAFGNTAAGLVAALSRAHGAEPDRLWGTLAAAVRGTGTADAPHLLRDPLPLKATTAMRLAAHPLNDIWTALDNPMAAHT